ncbi:MAG: SRPBCC domain-containing protein [Asticcacaulis sp.]|nr:SRPBCC domain-containing protein [Asticcacaulis sp.]
MTQPVVHHTFIIEKIYPKPPAAVFAAFSDPAQKSRWLSAGRQAMTGFELDFRVGGREFAGYLMGADTPFEGAKMTSDGLYLDIVQNERIVIGSNMAMNDRSFSAALLTFEFLADGDSTKLILTHQGAFFEHSDGPEMRQHGWTKLLDQLADTL